MITVSQALEHLFHLTAQLPHEMVDLRDAAGRMLAKPLAATRSQPPFAASSMDGYAVKGLEADLYAQFKVVGEAAAGHSWKGIIKAGHAVRIFTGAPVPDGVDKVIIQENVEKSGSVITVIDSSNLKSNIRPAGVDFEHGQILLTPPCCLSSGDIALLAAMNHATVPVIKKPVIALIATGDELVMPGESPHQDQIIASNNFGLAAMFEAMGATVRVLPIARDTNSSLKSVFKLTAGADLIITIGGASVGDHDLVANVAAELGMQQAFYKVAMRPGKPLMAGRMNGIPMVGLPGNPVSAMVCGTVFIKPMLLSMMGLPQLPAPRIKVILASDLIANGPREHYMRAIIKDGKITDAGLQDSSLLTVFARSNALLVRPPHDPFQRKGTMMDAITLD